MIRLSKSCISEDEKRAVLKVLDNEYLGMGKEVQNFEKVLNEYLKRPVSCVSSGTAALHLALQAIGVKSQDEVLVPSLTYVASYQAISATGAKPVSCDVYKDNLLLDIQDAENRITKNTKAIMPVHYAGNPGSLNEVYKLAEKYQLRVIEDAAHAFGTKYKDKSIGSFGDIVCFSFDGIKNITSGEGGCVVSNDIEVIERVNDARLLGVEKDTVNRFKNQRSWNFDINFQGWRYHMSDIMASIGIVQLKRFPEFAKIRQLLAKRYQDSFRGNKNLSILNIDYSKVVPHIFPIILNKGISRDDFMNRLLEKNIQTGIHYFPNHKLSLYKNKNQLMLPVTEDIYQNIVTLPLHADILLDEIDYIVDEVNKILK